MTDWAARDDAGIGRAVAIQYHVYSDRADEHDEVLYGIVGMGFVA